MEIVPSEKLVLPCSNTAFTLRHFRGHVHGNVPSPWRMRECKQSTSSGLWTAVDLFRVMVVMTIVCIA